MSYSSSGGFGRGSATGFVVLAAIPPKGNIVKSLFMLLVLCLVGLGGYQLGRQPNSPDVVGHLKTQAAQVDWQALGQKAGGAVDGVHRQLSNWNDRRQTAVAPAPAKTAPAAAAQNFPQCW